MNSLSRCQPVLGTYVEVEISASVSDRALMDLSQQAFAELRRIHYLMSYHDPSSELSEINRNAAVRSCELSRDMFTVLSQALELSQASRGIFDISIASTLVKQGSLPQHGYSYEPKANWQNIELCNQQIRFSQPLCIDLGGIAKGYAVDCVMDLFDHEIKITVNAGGDLRLSHWRDQPVAIRCPDGNGSQLQLSMQAPALATSASYFLDQISAMVLPSKRCLQTSPLSYSVFADTCILADALTKIAYLSDNAGPILERYNALGFSLNTKGVISPLL